MLTTKNFAADMPDVCYIWHVTTGDTVMIRHGEMGYVAVETYCSPKYLNARLPRVPTGEEIEAMRHAPLMAWDGPGISPAFWRAQRERTL